MSGFSPARFALAITHPLLLRKKSGLGSIAHYPCPPILRLSRIPHSLEKIPPLPIFLLTFAISWTAALIIAAAKLFQLAPLPKLTGILMFPAMLLGPSIAGIFLTRKLDGRDGLKDLFARMRRVRFPLRWYTALLVPPVLVLSVLFCLGTFESPVYAPNRFWIGVTFGLLAGFLEEIGWTGLAYAKLRRRFAVLPAAAILGLFWGLWHAPVIATSSAQLLLTAKLFQLSSQLS